jgi:hypothetical protein
VFEVRIAAAAGLVIATVGPTTFTLIAEEFITVPLESVTRAVNAVIPATAGLQENK